ncbi:MAG: LON peptidase substrate-binding domain-containing protein, partial [Chloroflexi bacterium]|nr:LON peptidase substrate-binding domain-containing protein [Chloroflexota bacterium]
MSASRWYSNLTDFLEWVGDIDTAVDEIFLPSILTRLQKKDEQDKQPQPEQVSEAETIKYPVILPILPLRGVVVYPQTAVPLTIGQLRSIKLIDDVSSGDRLIGLVAALNPEIENPGPADLYPTGTIAVVHRLFRAPDNTIRLLVQGLVRFRLGEFIQEEPYLKAKIELAAENVETGLEIDALARNARDQFEQIAEMSPSIPKELVASITTLEDPLQTIYTIANFQRIELQEAQQILEFDSTQEKLHKLVGVLVREVEVLQLGQKIQNQARSEIEKVQRDYFLREQLKAIQKELGEKDEQSVEVEEFHKKIETARMPEEAEKQAKRELERLSRMHTAAAEYG